VSAYLNATIERLVRELQMFYRLRDTLKRYGGSRKKGWSREDTESEIIRIESEIIRNEEVI